MTVEVNNLASCPCKAGGPLGQPEDVDSGRQLPQATAAGYCCRLLLQLSQQFQDPLTGP